MRERRLQALILYAILILAAVLRFQNLNAIQHNVDHAYPIWQALMTLDRGVFPVIGQGTSVLFANPALTGYLFVPFVAITRSPIGPYVFVIVLNTLAVWFAYRATAILLDDRQALIAALLMAINPWVIEYSRTTWVQALLPFFVCLVFWLLVPVLLDRSAHPRRRLLLALIGLTLASQTYLLVFALVLPVALLLVIFRQRIAWRTVAIGVAVFAAATTIYAAGLYANRDDTLAKLNAFTSDAPAQFVATAWQHAVRLVSGENYAAARSNLSLDTDRREWLSEAAHYVILAAILAGILGALYGLWCNWKNAGSDLIVLIWFALPIALMSYTSKPVHPFYLLLTLPAGYVLAARGAGLLMRWRFGSALVALIAVPIACLLSLNTVRFAQDTLSAPGAHGLGALPVGAGIQMMRDLVPADVVKPDTVIHSDVDEWTLNSFAGQLFPVNRDIDTARLSYIPTGGAIYVLFADNQTAIPPPIGNSNVRTFLLGDGTAITRYQVLPASVPAWNTPSITSDRGISFLGAVFESETSLLTYWRVDQLPPERGGWLLGPFAHVLDSSGKQIANVSGAVVPGFEWRLGEIYVERLMFSIPAGAVRPLHYHIGQYDGVHAINAIFNLPDKTSNAEITVSP